MFLDLEERLYHNSLISMISVWVGGSRSRLNMVANGIG